MHGPHSGGRGRQRARVQQDRGQRDAVLHQHLLSLMGLSDVMIFLARAFVYTGCYVAFKTPFVRRDMAYLPSCRNSKWPDQPIRTVARKITIPLADRFELRVTTVVNFRIALHRRHQTTGGAVSTSALNLLNARQARAKEASVKTCIYSESKPRRFQFINYKVEEVNCFFFFFFSVNLERFRCVRLAEQNRHLMTA